VETLPNGIRPDHIAGEVADAILAVAVLTPERRRAVAAALHHMANTYTEDYADRDKADAMTTFSRLCLAVNAVEGRRERNLKRAYRAERRKLHGITVERDTRPSPEILSQENIEALSVEYAAIALDEVEVS
jgi:hypothetical protein